MSPLTQNKATIYGLLNKYTLKSFQ